MANTPPRKSRSTQSTNFTKLTPKDKERFVLEQIRENAPDIETLTKVATVLARTRRAMYEAHIEAGFTEEQALRLCQNNK